MMMMLMMMMIMMMMTIKSEAYWILVTVLHHAITFSSNIL